MAYTTIDDPSKHFHIQLYTGTGSSRSVTNDADGGDFQPDLVITTSRSNGYNRAMFDTSRGVQKELKTNSNAAQATLTTGLSAFDSDGFSFNGASYNTSSYTFVAWQWKANGGSTTTNDASATGVGSQDSVYQANTTAGFSISTRVGTGSAGASYAHGLGGKPDVIIQKEYDDTNDWYSYFRVMGDGTHWIMLESTNGAVDDANMWNDTAPTSTIFTVGNSGGSNGSGENYIAYCWKASGGGSSNTDGTITSSVSVDTTSGFSIVEWTAADNKNVGHGLGGVPALIITKSAQHSGAGWVGWHQKLTGGSNIYDRYIYFDNNVGEGTNTNYWYGDSQGITSTVFGVENNGHDNNNGSMLAFCWKEVKGFSKFGVYKGFGDADGPFVYTGFKPAFIMIKARENTQDFEILDDKRGASTANPVEKNLEFNTNDSENTDLDVDFYSNGFKLKKVDDSINNGSWQYIYAAFAAEPLVANSGDDGIPATAR